MVDKNLFDVLRSAYAPCCEFERTCSDYCRWDEPSGYVPRGFGGATGAISDVRLILVTAEPGDPADGETYSGSDCDMFRDCKSMFTKSLSEGGVRRDGRPAPFHRNLRKILNLCWPNCSFEDQLRKTWFTNTVLCSAKVSGGSVPRAIEKTCVSIYLARQIKLLENAFVLALGRKAENRLTRNDVRMNFSAIHPSAREKNEKKMENWEKAAQVFRNWLERPLCSASG